MPLHRQSAAQMAAGHAYGGTGKMHVQYHISIPFLLTCLLSCVNRAVVQYVTCLVDQLPLSAPNYSSEDSKRPPCNMHLRATN